MAVRVVEVVSCVPKCVHLQLREKILRQLLQKPIYHQTAFYTSLGMEDEDYFGFSRVVQHVFEDPVHITDVGRRIRKVPLNQTLYEVKYDTTCRVVDAKYWAFESDGQPIQIPLEPVSTRKAINIEVEVDGSHSTHPTDTPLTNTHCSCACSGLGGAYFASDLYVASLPFSSLHSVVFSRTNTPMKPTAIQTGKMRHNGREMRNPPCKTRRKTCRATQNIFPHVADNSLKPFEPET